jgi:Spy/CpxP family protein refolding chaperone
MVVYVRMPVISPRRHRPRLRRSRARGCAAAIIAIAVIGRPVRLTSLRWWQLHEIQTSIRLTSAQRDAIEHLYEVGLADRRRCVEREAEAAYRVGQLIDDGVYDDSILRETQAAAGAAADERVLVKRLTVEIAAVLSRDQQDALAASRAGRIIE